MNIRSFKPGQLVKINAGYKKYYSEDLRDKVLKVADYASPYSSHVPVHPTGKKVPFLKRVKSIYRHDLKPVFDGDLSKYA